MRRMGSRRAMPLTALARDRTKRGGQRDSDDGGGRRPAPASPTTGPIGTFHAGGQGVFGARPLGAPLGGFSQERASRALEILDRMQRSRFGWSGAAGATASGLFAGVPPVPGPPAMASAAARPPRLFVLAACGAEQTLP